MNKSRISLFIGIAMLMVSCSSIRLAVYDYQKKNAYAMENRSHISGSEMTKERNSKQAITDNARKYIGAPYKYGSCDAGKGFDCSGLVYHVAQSQEINLPRSSSLMANAGKHLSWKKAESGDLIFFGDGHRIHHVGIVEKNKGDEMWIIHSSSSKGVLSEDILVSDYWSKRALFAIDITSLKRKA